MKYSWLWLIMILLYITPQAIGKLRPMDTKMPFEPSKPSKPGKPSMPSMPRPNRPSPNKLIMPSMPNMPRPNRPSMPPVASKPIKPSKSSNKSNDISTYYITNWDQYKMPKPVSLDVLKVILEKLALYKRLEYCPLGDPNECTTMKQDVENIVEIVVAGAKDKKKDIITSDEECPSKKVSPVEGKRKKNKKSKFKPVGQIGRIRGLDALRGKLLWTFVINRGIIFLLRGVYL